MSFLLNFDLKIELLYNIKICQRTSIIYYNTIYIIQYTTDSVVRYLKHCL